MLVPDGIGNPMYNQTHPRQMSKTIWVQVECDDYYGGTIIENLRDYLQNWNQVMHTEYKSMEDFNEGEEWRAIYKINQ
jgi:hypothetical protein